jgi:hypothetical protein
MNKKIGGICPLKKFFTITPSLVSTVSFKVVPLGTVANSTQGDYFKGDG